MTAARDIRDFLPGQIPSDVKYAGHLLDIPLTSGDPALLDPEEIISVSVHRAEEEVTVVRTRNDTFTLFVDMPYEQMKRWIQHALSGPGHLLVLPLTSGGEAMLDPEEIAGVSVHRKEKGVTVIKQRNDTYTLFVAEEYDDFKLRLQAALDALD